MVKRSVAFLDPFVDKLEYHTVHRDTQLEIQSRQAELGCKVQDNVIQSLGDGPPGGLRVQGLVASVLGQSDRHESGEAWFFIIFLGPSHERPFLICFPRAVDLLSFRRHLGTFWLAMFLLTQFVPASPPTYDLTTSCRDHPLTCPALPGHSLNILFCMLPP